MIREELKDFLTKEGYSYICEREGRGVCAIFKFMFTVGVVCGIDSTGYRGRWCYGSEVEAVYAITQWDGVGDPPGNWIKDKGEGGERSNEN